jgi:hypothetical protein
VRAGLHNSWLPVGWAAGTTVLVCLALQTMLLAVALGTADYRSGRPDGLTPVQVQLGSGMIALLAAASGSAVARHRLRQTGFAPRTRARVIAAGPGVTMLAIAVDGGLRGADPAATMILLVGGGLGLLGVLTVDRRGGDRSGAR